MSFERSQYLTPLLPSPSENGSQGGWVASAHSWLELLLDLAWNRLGTEITSSHQLCISSGTRPQVQLPPFSCCLLLPVPTLQDPQEGRREGLPKDASELGSSSLPLTQAGGLCKITEEGLGE